MIVNFTVIGVHAEWSRTLYMIHNFMDNVIFRAWQFVITSGGSSILVLLRAHYFCCYFTESICTIDAGHVDRSGRDSGEP